MKQIYKLLLKMKFECFSQYTLNEYIETNIYFSPEIETLFIVAGENHLDLFRTVAIDCVF